MNNTNININDKSYNLNNDRDTFLFEILRSKLKLKGSKLAFNLPNYKKELEKKYKIKIDYLEFRDEKNLKLNNFKDIYRLFVAYKIDNVRLIDNY